jgi:hypothetical protein
MDHQGAEDHEQQGDVRDARVRQVRRRLGGPRLGKQHQREHRRGARYAAQHLPAPCGGRDGGDAAVRGKTGDQTDQESRSAGHRAAPIMTVMDITIHATFLPHDDPDASPAFYRDTLGFEVPNDVIDIQGDRAVDFRASRSSLSSTRHTGSM